MYLVGAAAGTNAVVGRIFSAAYSTDSGGHFNGSTFSPEPVAKSQSIVILSLVWPELDSQKAIMGLPSRAMQVRITRSSTYQNCERLLATAHIRRQVWPDMDLQDPDNHHLSRRLLLNLKSGTVDWSPRRQSRSDEPGTWAAQIVRSVDAGQTWQTVFGPTAVSTSIKSAVRLSSTAALSRRVRRATTFFARKTAAKLGRLPCTYKERPKACSAC